MGMMRLMGFPVSRSVLSYKQTHLEKSRDLLLLRYSTKSSVDYDLGLQQEAHIEISDMYSPPNIEIYQKAIRYSATPVTECSGALKVTPVSLFEYVVHSANSGR